MAGYAKKRLNADEVLFQNDTIVDANDPNNKVAFTAVVKDAFGACDHLNALGFFTNPPLVYDRSVGVGRAYMSYVYGACAACVSVDTRTGETSVDDFFCRTRCRPCVRSRRSGGGRSAAGVSMGVGYALMEEVELSHGKIKNLNLENYLLPTALDMPRLNVTVLELPGRYGPLGAKGIGEPATSIVAPAVINAIAHATGLRIRSLPANLERVALGKELKKE